MSVSSFSRRRLSQAGAIVAATSVVCLAVAHAGGHDPAGVGDEYLPEAGNGGYDVSEYRIKVEYLPETKSIEGQAVIEARATSDMDVLHLDFKQKVSEVRVNGVPTPFETKSDHELVITPKNRLGAGRLFWVDVTYAGSIDPQADEADDSGYAGVGPTADGGMIAVGQPHSAWWWYPSNDHPIDKATYKVEVTAPEGYSSFSNGNKTAEFTKDGKTTVKWAEDKPMATYLAFLAIGKFEVEKSWSYPGGKAWTAIATEGIDEDIRKNAKEALNDLPEIVKWATEEFGPYPFSTSGGVVPAKNFGFALETQSRPVYSPVFWKRGPGTGVVVHETAHQWFGNSVSINKWQDIWLNEGFATWAQWKYLEDRGEETSNESFERFYRLLEDSEDAKRPDFWKVTIGDPGEENLFNLAVYYRGAMAVQALRNKIGDDDHKRLLQAWTAKHAYSNASIPEFIAMAEEISGQDLEEFFNVWLFTAEKPAPMEANGIPDPSWAEPWPAEQAAAATAELREELLNHPHGHNITGDVADALRQSN